MKKKVREIIENVPVEAIAAEGRSICKVDGKVIFVPFAIPGDVIDIEITRKRSSWMEGRIKQIVTPSPQRVAPFCSHYGLCGGCKWQPLPYSLQLQYKEQQVVDQLSRIGGLELPKISPIVGSKKTTEYRNKLEYTFSNRRWVDSISDAQSLSDTDKLGLGFHISGRFDKVLDLDRCYLQPEPSNEIRDYIKEFAIKNGYPFFDLVKQTGFLRTLIIRTSNIGETMVILVVAYEDNQLIDNIMSSIISTFPQITSLNFVINTKGNDTINDLEVINFSGRDYILEEMEGLKFRVGPKSFFQTNSEQAYKLYSIVRDYASLSGNEIVYDLYTGTGTIALFLADKSKKVIGVEYVPEAIKDAEINAKMNNIDNSLFYSGDTKDIITHDFVSANGVPNVLVLDPPRAGVHASVIDVILDIMPGKIIYVSCNPATQARDLSLLKESYKVLKVQPIDMFPHTHHVENIVLLEPK